MHFNIGTRGSKLALRQTELVVDGVKNHFPDLELDIKKIKTGGDKDRKSTLAQIGGQGIFIKELEEALRARYIDMAVHSLKDVPSDLSPEFKLAAVCMRTDPRDAFISRSGRILAELPVGACIATGSERRAVQVRQVRPDVRIVPLRGNIDTRLRKLQAGEIDGIIMAAAALARLHWQEHITEYLSTDQFLPAVGQGAITIEIRSGEGELDNLLAALDEEPTRQCVEAERAFLRTLGGGCRAPIAALGTAHNGILHLDGMVASPDGTALLRLTRTGALSNPLELGRMLAHQLLDLGAAKFIAETST